MAAGRVTLLFFCLATFALVYLAQAKQNSVQKRHALHRLARGAKGKGDDGYGDYKGDKGDNYKGDNYKGDKGKGDKDSKSRDKDGKSRDEDSKSRADRDTRDNKGKGTTWLSAPNRDKRESYVYTQTESYTYTTDTNLPLLDLLDLPLDPLGWLLGTSTAEPTTTTTKAPTTVASTQPTVGLTVPRTTTTATTTTTTAPPTGGSKEGTPCTPSEQPYGCKDCKHMYVCLTGSMEVSECGPTDACIGTADNSGCEVGATCPA